MGKGMESSREVPFVVFDFRDDQAIEGLLRQWGLDVSPDHSLIRRGVMGTPHRSDTMVAYITPAPDGAEQIHVDAGSAPDLVERLAGDRRTTEVRRETLPWPAFGPRGESAAVLVLREPLHPGDQDERHTEEPTEETEETVREDPD